MPETDQFAPPSLESLGAQYEEIAPQASRFMDEVTHQLHQLVAEKKVSLSFPIQSRVKQWDSIVEKIERKALRLNRVQELSDLVGLRIILQFKRDINTVCDLITAKFSILERYDTQDRLQEDQFGYSSIHFVIELLEAWLAVPTMANMKGLKAEIQVRTTAQHIWAEASHTLQYKHAESVPLPVRRAMYRVSALLETIDLEFERVLEQRQTYRSRSTTSSQDETLNADLLEEILDQLLPPANKKKNEEQYSELLEDLRAFGIESQSLLRDLLCKNKDAILRDDEDVVEKYEQGSLRLMRQSISTARRIMEGVFYTNVGLVRESLQHEYGAQVRKYIINKYQAGE
jgi:GTP pyrophosphokinase